jgi:hypothetical protein
MDSGLAQGGQQGRMVDPLLDSQPGTVPRGDSSQNYIDEIIIEINEEVTVEKCTVNIFDISP